MMRCIVHSVPLDECGCDKRSKLYKLRKPRVVDKTITKALDDGSHITNMPPKSSMPVLIIAAPKCECCGHKHEKYVLVCSECFTNMKREND